MTARFHTLAATELDIAQLKALDIQLEANLTARLDALASHARLRVRDRPQLSEVAKEAFQAEMKRLRLWMIDAPKTPN